MEAKKKLNAPKVAATVDIEKVAQPTGNIYEAIIIIAKRAAQIADELKLEINEKMEEFNIPGEILEEVFENREQIELSRYFENLPKPHLMALQEWLDGEIYYRYAESESKPD
ncbi:MAG: hypothetical protein ACK4KT_06910 [Thermaurantimonas sp.]